MANVQFVENFHQFRLSVCDVVHQIVTPKRVNAVELSSFQPSDCFLFRFFPGKKLKREKELTKTKQLDERIEREVVLWQKTTETGCQMGGIGYSLVLEW